jgi:polynucleotide 5'-triphosphatase
MNQTPVKAEPTNGHHRPGAARPSPVPQVEFRGDGPLGPWEPSITGFRPFEEVSKLVADWLFVQVVTRADAGELASRGVQIEIEAKLGQLIHKDTNERFYLPVQSECILADSRQITFRSSMTEVSSLAQIL